MLAEVPFEVWASPEPSVVRVDANRVRDQIVDTGHDVRDGDIELLASLGIGASRYPVLFERTAPKRPDVLDLAWATRRLSRLRELDVEPVVTLLHHGSGPLYTSLLDPEFPQLFAQYAAGVAQAFPWVRRWTPINEPLTTARFSGLYGFWYPNGRDDPTFGRLIVHSVLAMLRAMEAISAVIPDAEFSITEDLQGYVALDRGVEKYVAHKRERRFLSIELAMGRVRAGHALYEYLTRTCGIAHTLLQEIERRARPPDLIGWDYYVNSERVLGTGADGTIFNDALVDHGAIDPLPLLREAHARIGLPFGLAEVHRSGSEGERVAWLNARAADLMVLAGEGYPVRMLGAWAAFGLVDWSSVLRDRCDDDEDGVFSFTRRGETPQETAVTTALRTLAKSARRGVDFALSFRPERM